MKKIFCTLMALAAITIGAWAAKPTVYVEKFGNPKDYSDAWITLMRNGVIEGLAKSGRINIVDAATEETRMNEELRRLQDNASHGDLETSKALEVLGSHYILNGDINTINVTETVLDSGTHSFDANVTMTLKVVNALDGSLISSETFTFPKQGVMNVGGMFDSLKKGVMESADAAVTNLKGNISGGLNKFIGNSFPLTGVVEAVDESKGKEAKTLYINLGSQDGLIKGNKLEVRSEKKIGTKVIMKNIGEVEAADVDDEMTLCKVKKGGVEIMEAVSSGSPVIVRSLAK